MSDRLEYLRNQIRQENISYGEILELQSLADKIDPSDVELLEWAGVPEFDARYPGTTEVVPGVFLSAGEAVYIADDEGEIVMWNADEWAEDPEAVTAAIAAVALAAKDGPAAVRKSIQQRKTANQTVT